MSYYGNYWVKVLALVLGIVLAFAIWLPARAQHAQHEHESAPVSELLMGYHDPNKHHQLHHWYKKLMRPDQPGTSCCSKEDCVPTRAELRDGEWWAMRNGVWVKIPPEKINAEDSYDTSAHICFPPPHKTHGLYGYEPGRIFCFVKPGIGG